VSWGKYLAKRIVSLAFVLLGLSILIFTISRVLPGDPARLALGPRASEEAVEALRKQLHLDQPYPIQYLYWLKDALSGKLGQSLYTYRDVSQDIREFFPATLELVLYAAIFNAIGAITLGVLAGRHAGKWPDHITRILSYVSVAVPSFVFAIFFQLLFSYYFNIFPSYGRLSDGVAPPPTITGLITIDSLITGNLNTFVDALKHLILPSLSLALGMMGQEARITRSSIVENSRKDFIVNMESHGISERKIMFKYLLKPSLIPTISVMGLDIAGTLANAFLVETIFNWPGFSKYGVNVMLRKDLNGIVGVVMMVGLTFAVINLIVDIFVAYLDPRIRYSMGGK
jgi:peptide/nickel transport system permease protein